MVKQTTREADTTPSATALRLPPTANGAADVDAIRDLRRFHLTGLDAPEKLPRDLLPALLHPYRDSTGLRDGFPLFVSVTPSDGDLPDGEGSPVAITELLHGTFADVFADGEARVLHDNLARLERAVIRASAAETGPYEARAALESAGAETLSELSLAGDAESSTRADLDRLLGAIPSGLFVPQSGLTPLHLLLLAKQHVVDARRAAARRSITEVRDRVVSFLNVDRSKSDSGRAPDTVARSLGGGVGNLVDPSSVVKMLGRVRGAVPMAHERRERVEAALAVIDRFLDDHDDVATTLVIAKGTESGRFSETWKITSAEDPFAAAYDLAGREAESVLELCRALRTTRLELEGRYDSARHDAWISALAPESLTEEELDLLPPTFVFASAADAESKWVQSLYRALRSRWPVGVVLFSRPLAIDDAGSGMEIAYLGVGHRRAFVQQGSISRPRRLYEGFARGLAAARPSLHVVDVGETSDGGSPSIGRWLRASAAIEGRAHPLFRFDPSAGVDWASRFDVSENPEVEALWSTGDLTITGDDGAAQQLTISFTFADLALLDPTMTGELSLAPTGSEEALVTVDEYLEMAGDERAGHVPCVWAADTTGALMRVAVTERLCRACGERGDFWHTLQELAGVRSTYVERAEARVRDALEADTAERVERLGAEHAEALAEARAAAASDAMEGLARYLLDMGGDFALTGDTGGASVAAPSEPSPAAGAEVAEPEAPAEPAGAEQEAADEEEAVSIDEPWIETVLCTSCNDCTAINPKLFVYDGNKQAYIGDVEAGTFAELVLAAEKCPARCIHPGKPRDPSERNLEELVRRAAPFNV